MSRIRITCHGEAPAAHHDARRALEKIAAVLASPGSAEAAAFGSTATLEEARAIAHAALNPPPPRWPVINATPAQWCDVFLELVDDDGKTHPIHNVTGITWRAAQGTEPASATIDFFDVDIDAELEVHRAFSVDVGGNARRPAGVDDEETSS